MGVYQIRTEQFLPVSPDAAWKFLSDPHNLKVITPDYMGFHVLTPDLPNEIYPGMIIQYTVSPVLKIPMRWVTEITHVETGKYFVDEQRVGPYRMWHHEHHLIPASGGVIMRDIVTYQPPFGILGNMANTMFIRKQLNAIFTFREQALNRHFGITTSDEK